MEYPQQFSETVGRIFGDAGRAWLPQLPEILQRCRKQWGLPQGTPCPAMRINYIEYTTTPDGEPAVLKVGVPHRENFTEMEALAIYDGRGAARLLAADRELGAKLIQRVLPGTMLWEVGDNGEQTQVAASVMKNLAAPVPPHHGMPHFSQWLERAFRLTRTEWDPEALMPRGLIDRAEQAFDRVMRESISPGGDGEFVLHGDFHHENILWDERHGWLVIDPQGVIGPRSLEVGRYIQNQLPEGAPFEVHERIVRERIEIFSAELGKSQAFIAASALVDCVLSHCWCFEDEVLNPDWHEGITLGWYLSDLMDTGG